MGKKRGTGNLIDNYVDWQKKQYTPWSYIQSGKLLPHIEATGNPKRVALLWFFQSALSLIIGITVVVGINTRYSSSYREGYSHTVERYYFEFSMENSWPVILLFGGLALIGLAGGIVYWQRYKRKKMKRKTAISKKKT